MPKIVDLLEKRRKTSEFFLDSFSRHNGSVIPKPKAKRRRKKTVTRVEVEDKEEFFNVTTEQAGELCGVSPNTIRNWINKGKLRGQRNPIRTSIKGIKELQEQLLVEPPAPIPAAKPRTYHKKNRQPWQFIDPDESGSN